MSQPCFPPVGPRGSGPPSPAHALCLLPGDHACPRPSPPPGALGPGGSCSLQPPPPTAFTPNGTHLQHLTRDPPQAPSTWEPPTSCSSLARTAAGGHRVHWPRAGQQGLSAPVMPDECPPGAAHQQPEPAAPGEPRGPGGVRRVHQGSCEQRRLGQLGQLLCGGHWGHPVCGCQ